MGKSTTFLGRSLVRFSLYGALALALGCGLFLYRGQQRLLDLVNRNSQRVTEVYSAWLELNPSAYLSRDYVLKRLEMNGYESVPEKLEKPGQYLLKGSDIDLWIGGFEYPDRSVPAQQIRLSFSGSQLSQVETLPDGGNVPSWRLEPKRLARWASRGGASQPQVRLEDLPRHVPMAVVAMEDKRFFEHGAIDIRGLMRAVWVNFRRQGVKQGGSTISQQLSRSIFLDISRTWTRKLLETGLAFYLEAMYSKEKLLEMYLNQVYWGQAGPESLLGLESVSRSLFGKPARELTLSESALLAGLLQSPNRYSPRADMRLARQRRNRVLALMLNQGLVSREQFQAAILEPIRVSAFSVRAGEAPYFVSSLQESLAERYSLNVLMSQGWRIFTTLDPVLQSHATSALQPSVGQAAMVVIEPQTGAIRAWVGGTHYGKSTFDRVVYAKRQPGSAFKPMVVLAALDRKQATPTTFLEDKPITIKTPQGPWAPQNYNKQYRGKVTVWDALVYSLNIPIVQLAMQTGLEHVADYAHRLGIKSPLRAVPSLALGTSEVTVLELTSAYATLANRGQHMEPYSIETILDAEGSLVESHFTNSYQAVPEASAFLVTEMLRGVLDDGTARFSRQMGFTYPAAGKTGTSENYQDAWFIGYTPGLACGVWVGYDQPQNLGRSAAGIALPIWVTFMQKALAYAPEVKWEAPKEGLVWKWIDLESGQLSRSGCPRRKKIAFVTGAEPEKPCELHPGGLRGLFFRLKNKVERSSSPV